MVVKQFHFVDRVNWASLVFDKIRRTVRGRYLRKAHRTYFSMRFTSFDNMTSIKTGNKSSPSIFIKLSKDKPLVYKLGGRRVRLESV